MVVSMHYTSTVARVAVLSCRMGPLGRQGVDVVWWQDKECV